MSRWPLIPFGELTENYDSVRVPVRESDRKRGSFPYYGASGIVDHVDGYLFDGEYLLIAEDGENLRTKQTPIAFIATGKFWVNNHVHIVRANDHNVTRYLMYAIRDADVASFLTGSTMPKLTKGNMNRVPVVAPPRDTQEAIASILGAIDDKIDLNRRMNDTLEAMARAIFKSWFVDFDPVRAKMEGREPAGMDVETAALFPSRMVQSESGAIPEGWSASTLGEHVTALSGGTPPKSEPHLWGGSLPWISPKVMTSIHADEVDLWVTDEAVGAGTRLAPLGAVLVMVRGMGLHQGVRVSQVRRSVTFNQDVKALVAREIDPTVLLFTLLDAQSFLLGRVQAAGNGTGVLPTDRLLSLPICVAPADVQEAGARALRPLNDRIAVAREESRTLASLRDLLLPRLLSGELRIRDAERAVEAAL
jgi:type I restriction enzyme S subunit